MNSVVVTCVSGIPDDEVVMPNHVSGKKVILYREPCCEKALKLLSIIILIYSPYMGGNVILYLFKGG